ncbi:MULTISPECIES: DUF6173 family protein [Erwinia]|uniref:DUF6173 family protein n=1 Tax=Erwinia TaxID=551 RepID=UPI0021010F5E|nr:MULTISPECIES: DUF6173 family protein [Erwinia]
MRDDGNPVELGQHVSQISVLLVRIKTQRPDEPKRLIGFAGWDEYDQQVEEWQTSWPHKLSHNFSDSRIIIGRTRKCAL